MTKANVTYILSSLGYSMDTWQEMPIISRINLASNSGFYWDDSRGRITEYYFDTSHELVYKRYLDKKTKNVINIAAIFSFSEISHIETLNAYSENTFVGNSYIRKS